ncbi:hypothetical protein CF319_g5794 [Tilletia indica]|nr:hypothetical protein CF319_g5794 [Tilletia indica]
MPLLPRSSPVTLPHPRAERQAIVDTHNAYRTIHNVPSLTWNSTLAAFAKNHASKYIWAHPEGPYGENGAATVGGVTTTMASSAVMWYDDSTMYNFSAPAFTEQTGHFSQLIWKSSRGMDGAIVQCTPASLSFKWPGPEMTINVWCEVIVAERTSKTAVVPSV